MAINHIRKNLFHNHIAFNVKKTMPFFNNDYYEVKEVTKDVKHCEAKTFPNEYKFLGFIKQMKHFITMDNKVYIKSYEDYQYKKTNQFWCQENKMLYTYSHPQQYKLLKMKKKKYFYDFINKDTYTFNHDKGIVVYAGIYNEKTNRISFTTK